MSKSVNHFEKMLNMYAYIASRAVGDTPVTVPTIMKLSGYSKSKARRTRQDMLALGMVFKFHANGRYYLSRHGKFAQRVTQIVSDLEFAKNHEFQF